VRLFEFFACLYQLQIKRFCKNTGNNRDSFCERVHEFGRSQTQKAVWAEKKYEKSLTSSSGSGTIKLDRKWTIKTKIQVLFNIKYSYAKATCFKHFQKYGIDTNGITFKMQRYENFLSKLFYGSTDYNKLAE
jgi:hypothetical protein